ncbi:MAG: GDSL-type esterase/lipase family protein [Lachnospiraceae bacterium]|nr:GDSL-type esterase/lipase family protein [Lachnospiraceae bacterium]
MFCKRFVFGTGEKIDDMASSENRGEVVHVSAADLYQPGKGYGFVTEENRKEQEFLKLPELNSGFDPLYWYQDEILSYIEEDAYGCFLESDRMAADLKRRETADSPGDASKASFTEEEHRQIPLIFKLDVPEQGNYRVTVKICASGEANYDWLIFTGRRRLGLLLNHTKQAGSQTKPFAVDCAGNQPEPFAADRTGNRTEAFLTGLPENSGFEIEHTMTANVCDIIPRGRTKACCDTTLDITILSAIPRISELTVEQINCPTVYIAGDSTVTDQSADYPYAPGTSYSGWGQMLPAYLTGEVAVSNHAHSGLTTESFREEGHYAIVEKYIREGDFCLFQFAHNDQKLEHLKAQGGYRTNLERYIEECRQRGAFPLLVTPLARNTWKGSDGSYNDLLREYAQVCREIGEEFHVPVLELHERSMAWITQRGREAVRTSFFPDDYTHTNDYGAYRMAEFVAEELVRVCKGWPEYQRLADCVTAGFGDWNPPAHIALPVKPAAYEQISNPEGEALLLTDLSEPDRPACRADVLDMVIQTVRFFYTNVYNDMFADVIGHEWYAGAVECAWQNGIIDGNLVENGCFYPEKEVTLEEFFSFAVNGYKSRKKLPAEKPCVYDEKCSGYARPYVRAACALGLLDKNGNEDLKRVITRGEAARLCRRMKV